MWAGRVGLVSGACPLARGPYDLPWVEIRHLRYFVAVAEELNFGRAAERMHVAQPGLSQQIKVLEAELGVVLFDRDRRRVRLTEEGLLLLGEAYAVLGRFDQCVETMRQARVGGRRELVRMGMFSEFSRSWTPALLAEIRRRHPKVVLAVEAVPSSAAVRAVEVGAIDLGVVRSVPERSGVVRRLLASEPLGACLPVGHRAQGGAGIVPASLMGEQLLWMPRSSNPEYYDGVLAVLREAGLDVGTVEAPGTAAASMALVASGYGWCLACPSEVAAAVSEHAVIWLALDGVELVAETWAVWSRNGAGAAVARVVDVLAELVGPARMPSRLEKASF
jgi:DNA-binding transcriptional LysR family regulator